jgi:hypothetical protein
MATNDVQTTLAKIGDLFNFRTTSTYRTPEYNSQVGGVSNSQHITGTARDYSVQGKTQSQIDAFLDELKEYGFEAFTHKTATGAEHVHAELPNGSDTGCPSWLPQSLCKGYKAVTKYSKYATPNGAVEYAVDSAKDSVSDWVSWQVRVALLGIALILIAIALVFTFKDTAAEVAVGSVTKALKGT